MAFNTNTVRTIFIEKIKKICINKQEDNNVLLSTKDYDDLIERDKKSRMYLKTIGERKIMKYCRV